MLSEREKQICQRLRRFREILQIPRARFALTIGVTSDRLTGCELGRAPVRYETFSAIQNHFQINPVWLATGGEAVKWDRFSDEKFRDQIHPRELFSSVFDRLLERYLTMDRVNAEGHDFNLRLLENWTDPRTLERLKKARVEAGVTLQSLAETLAAACRTKLTAKDLEKFESGKKIPNVRIIGAWKDELRLKEVWLWKGIGEMFENPFSKTPEYLERLKETRLKAGLSVEEVVARLRARTTARLTAREMELVEAGKRITTHSLMIGLPFVLGVEAHQLFGTSHSLKQALAEAREALRLLGEKFQALDKHVSELDSDLPGNVINNRRAQSTKLS